MLGAGLENAAQPRPLYAVCHCAHCTHCCHVCVCDRIVCLCALFVPCAFCGLSLSHFQVLIDQFSINIEQRREREWRRGRDEWPGQAACEFLCKGERAGRRRTLLSRQANCFAGVHQPNALDRAATNAASHGAREAEVAEKRERERKREGRGRERERGQVQSTL